MLMTPLTRGSTTKLRPVISATALTTASMSALTKFSVTASSAAWTGNVSTRPRKVMVSSRGRDIATYTPRRRPGSGGNDSMRVKPTAPVRFNAHKRLNPLASFAPSKGHDDSKGGFDASAKPRRRRGSAGGSRRLAGCSDCTVAFRRSSGGCRRASEIGCRFQSDGGQEWRRDGDLHAVGSGRRRPSGGEG